MEQYKRLARTAERRPFSIIFEGGRSAGKTTRLILQPALLAPQNPNTIGRY